MNHRKAVSALTASSLLICTVPFSSAVSASNSEENNTITISDYTYDETNNTYLDSANNTITLQSGSIVEISDAQDLRCLSLYAASNETEGITWKLTDDINVSGYTFAFDEKSGVVEALSNTNEVVFCIGTGINGTEYNTSSASKENTIYAPEAATGTLSESALPSDLNSEISPIGTEANEFSGSFDGNGYKISGIYNQPGLFGCLNNADIYNLTVSDSYICSSSTVVGGIAVIIKGSALNYCVVNNCFVCSYGDNPVGGVIGSVIGGLYNESNVLQSTVNGCSFTGNGYVLSAASGICGGIIGNTTYQGGSSAVITNCLNTCTIKNLSSVNSGGICGQIAYNFTINNSLNIGNIIGGTCTDVITINYGGSVSDCYYLDSVKTESILNNFNQTAVSQAQLESGYVTYLLSLNSTSDSIYWNQNLSEENSLPSVSLNNSYPVYCSNGAFTNTPPDVHLHGDDVTVNSDGTHTYKCVTCLQEITEKCVYENGICKVCGRFAEPSTVLGSYKITNYGELCWFANEVNSGNNSIGAYLYDNITASDEIAWTPIGTVEYPYKGTFNGRNYTISGLECVSESSNYIGLFGNISGANISSFGILNSQFSGANYVGAIAGIASTSSISFCYVDNTTTVEAKNTNVGSIAGSAASSNIYSSYAASTLNICGELTETEVSGCYIYGDGGKTENGIQVDEACFTNGYVAYMLINWCSENGYQITWGQDLSQSDSLPVLDASLQVVCMGDHYANGSVAYHSATDVVSNNNGTHNLYCTFCELDVTEECKYENGFCSVCGYFDDSAASITYTDAGTYILPTPTEKIGGAQNLGWIDENGNLYRCGETLTVEANASFDKVTVDLNTFAASARLNSDSTGIRFATQLDLVGADYEGLNIQAGTLICPSDYATNDAFFNYETFVENGYVALIYDDNENIFNEVDVNGYIYDNAYFGSIVNIYPFNYGREFVGCGFVKVEYADGTCEYYYAQQKSRESIYTLAAKAYGDRSTEQSDEYSNETSDLNGTVYYSCYTSEQLETLCGFIDGVVDLTIDKTNKTAQIRIPEGIEELYTRPYEVSADFDNGSVTVSGEDWTAYSAVVKNSQTLYARKTVLINGQRIVPGDSTWSVPASYADSALAELEIIFSVN